MGRESIARLDHGRRPDKIEWSLARIAHIPGRIGIVVRLDQLLAMEKLRLRGSE